MPEQEDLYKAVHSDWYELSRSWRKAIDAEGRGPRLRQLGELYLPKMTGESATEYEDRKARAVYEGHFPKAVEVTAARPFAEQVELTAPPELKAWEDNVDRAGTSLTAYCRALVAMKLSRGMSHTLVMLPRYNGEGRPTMADYEAERLQPFFSLIDPWRLRYWELDEFNLPTQLNVWHSNYYDENRGSETMAQNIVVYLPEGYIIYPVEVSTTAGRYKVTLDNKRKPEEFSYARDFDPMLERPPIVTGYASKIGPYFAFSPYQQVLEEDLDIFDLRSRLRAYETSALARIQVYQGITALESKNQGLDDVANPKFGKKATLEEDQDIQWLAPTVESAATVKESIEAARKRIGDRVGDIDAAFHTATAAVTAEVRTLSELQAIVEETEEEVEQAYLIAAQMMGIDVQPTDIEVHINRDIMPVEEDIQSPPAAPPEGGDGEDQEV